MSPIQSFTASVSASIVVLAHSLVGGFERRASGRERGDVPGWVLITLMTAGLVTILWSLAADQMKELFTEAMNSVSGPGAR